jgi:hypothetical protein
MQRMRRSGASVGMPREAAGRDGLDRAGGSAAVQKREVAGEESDRNPPRTDKPAWRARTRAADGGRTPGASRHSCRRRRTVRWVTRRRQRRRHGEQHDQAERRKRQATRCRRSAAERRETDHRRSTAAVRGTSASARNNA